MNKTKAAAALVLRYLTARALFRKTDWDILTNLERKIAGGIRALPGGVLLNEVALMPEPAIVYDRNDPEFWAAIIGGDESHRNRPRGIKRNTRVRRDRRMRLTSTTAASFVVVIEIH